MHAGLLDVLHHAADQHLAGVVTHGVDVDLDGVVEEAVDEHRAVRRQPALPAEAAVAGELVHRLAQLAFVVDDAHRPPAEDVARAHEHRVADLAGDGERLVEVGGRATGRLGDAEVVAQPVPLLAVLGGVDRLGVGAGDELAQGSRRRA